MKLEKEVRAIDTACDQFLTSYNPGSLPRVAMRGMRPVLEALVALIKAGGHDEGLLQIFSYPINAQFERAKEGEESNCAGILCLRSDGTFHWAVVTTVHTPMGLMILGLSPMVEDTPEGKKIGFRQVTAEDLVELNISLYEVVERIREVANNVLINGMINMPPAQA